MQRNDALMLGIVSFVAGVFLSVGVIAILDPPSSSWSGIGCLCTAAIAAFVYRRQQDRRW